MKIKEIVDDVGLGETEWMWSLKVEDKALRLDIEFEGEEYYEQKRSCKRNLQRFKKRLADALLRH